MQCEAFANLTKLGVYLKEEQVIKESYSMLRRVVCRENPQGVALEANSTKIGLLYSIGGGRYVKKALPFPRGISEFLIQFQICFRI